jgi:hypothetical protein
MQANNTNSLYKFDLPKFSLDKWDTFKEAMELIFTSQDSWEVVNSTTPEPAANAAATRNNYKTKNKQAHTLLLLPEGRTSENLQECCVSQRDVGCSNHTINQLFFSFYSPY